jgi:phosphate transport system protein
MPEREHTSTQYEQQLRTLKEKLLLIGHKAETAIADATRALVERQPSLAQRVVDEDDQVDQLEIEIDDICFGILAREQPVASDLRYITTTMKIVADIERVGDNGVNIARRALEIMHEPELKPIIDVPVAAAAAQRILKESLDAFVNYDVQLAKRVIEGDKYIDAVCEQMLRELLTYMFEDPSTISRALRLIFVARNLERVGDHAANIAEMVIFRTSDTARRLGPQGPVRVDGRRRAAACLRGRTDSGLFHGRFQLAIGRYRLQPVRECYDLSRQTLAAFFQQIQSGRNRDLLSSFGGPLFEVFAKQLHVTRFSHQCLERLHFIRALSGTVTKHRLGRFQGVTQPLQSNTHLVQTFDIGGLESSP